MNFPSRPLNHLPSLGALSITLLFSACDTIRPVKAFTTLAYYYGWYGTPEKSGQWVHWADGGHDPSKTDAEGLPDIAAIRHPADGLYDSNDETTIRRHLDLAEQAGIDVFVVSWWGFDSFEDKSMQKLLEVMERQKSPIRFCAYYERFPQDRLDLGVADISAFVDRYGAHPNYFRMDDKPVMFLYGRVLFPPFYCFAENCPKDQPIEVDWRPYLGELQSKVFLSADGLGLGPLNSRVTEVMDQNFEGVHLYNPAPEMDLVDFDYAGHIAFYVEQAKERGVLPAVTVLPGYNDTRIGRPYAFDLDRRGGELYHELWSAAKASGAPWIIITSFNEWHEGTEIEPSAEFGDFYLRATREETQG